MLSAGKNYVRVLAGEEPEYVPQYSFGPMMGFPPPYSNYIMGPPVIRPAFDPDKPRTDLFGVPYVTTDSAGGAGLPANDHFILPLEGIENWGDYIKIPVIADVDWEAMATDSIKQSGINREESALTYSGGGGYFMQLMAFMGFENGMIALYEYPDSVKEMLDAISDMYVGVAKKCLHFYAPDIIGFGDDIATWQNPFVSPDMFREFFMPYHDKMAAIGRERGILMEMHCCGRTEDNIPIYKELGMNGWSAVQSCNDTDAVKAEYGDWLTIMGGWDPVGRLLLPLESPENPDGVTEEEIRLSARAVIDRLAPGGRYVWCSGYLAAVGDTDNQKKNEILQDEATQYGLTFYK